MQAHFESLLPAKERLVMASWHRHPAARNRCAPVRLPPPPPPTWPRLTLDRAQRSRGRGIILEMISQAASSAPGAAACMPMVTLPGLSVTKLRHSGGSSHTSPWLRSLRLDFDHATNFKVSYILLKKQDCQLANNVCISVSSC